MKHKTFNMVLVVIFAFTLWGCASTGSVTSTIAPTISLDGFKTLSVSVQTKAEDSEREAQAFKEILIAELKKKNKWEVFDGSPHGQLKLSATITNLNKVGTATRLIAGGLAGRASVDVEVSLKDAKGNVISQFSVNGKSSGGTQK